MAIEVYNHDVANLGHMVAKYAYEMYKARSNAVNDMSSFDVERFYQYTRSIRAYQAWIMAQPQLDLPEWTPTVEEVADWPEFETVENDSINTMIKLAHVCWFELVNSQSARVSTGMVSFDDNRFNAIVDKMEAFMKDYVENILPIDLPESTPSVVVSGVGRRGV